MIRRTEPVRTGTAGSAGWRVTRQRGAASSLVSAPAGPMLVGRRVVRAMNVCDATVPAFVLGSSQPRTDVDEHAASARGIDVCRRRTGGGGVLVLPGAQIWVDVFLSADDPLRDPDVGRSFYWLGDALAQAVGSVTGISAVVHRGPLRSDQWSSRLCFAGLGPGEVCVDGRKVIGLSQRRDAGGSWFRAMMLLRHAPEESASLLALGPVQRAEAAHHLARLAAAVDADARLLEERMIDAIVSLQ